MSAAVTLSGASVIHVSAGCGWFGMGPVVMTAVGSLSAGASAVGTELAMSARVAVVLAAAVAGTTTGLWSCIWLDLLPLVVALTVAGSASVGVAAVRSALAVVLSVNSDLRASVTRATVVVVRRAVGDCGISTWMMVASTTGGGASPSTVGAAVGVFVISIVLSTLVFAVMALVASRSTAASSSVTSYLG